MRFNAGALAAVEREPGITLGELISRMNLGDWFRRYYLLPMGGAIWSCPPSQMLSFPASTFVRFFENHGLLSLGGQPQWYTVEGGSQIYVEKMSEGFAHRVRTNCGAMEVRRERSGVRVKDVQGNWDRYDEVVFASHADETLALLGDAETAEREALGAIRYQRNRVILHKDPRFMPRRKACWASWVYHAEGPGEEPAIAVTYWMNLLQGIDQDYPLFVTLNPQSEIPSDQIFDEHLFDHPVFDTAAIAAQEKLKAMQGVRNTWFCGAHMRHGFHEDGLVSAMDVAAKLGAAAPWLAPQPVWRPSREPAHARPRFADEPVVAD
jgi:predicted NAD/FAD-binding protein